jgi:acetoin utilization deacetylase AcuC-like enzyme
MPGAPVRHHDRLIAAGLDMYLSFYDAPLATLEQIARVHPAEYVRGRCSAQCTGHGIVHLDPDTAMSPGTCARRCAPPAPACWRPTW